MIKNRKVAFYMSDDENIINPITRKSKNKLWIILSTIIAGGAEVYIKDASNRNYTGGWLYHKLLLVKLCLYYLVFLLIW